MQIAFCTKSECGPQAEQFKGPNLRRPSLAVGPDMPEETLISYLKGVLARCPRLRKIKIRGSITEYPAWTEFLKHGERVGLE